MEREAKDFEYYGQKWWRMFKRDYRSARRKLKSLCLAKRQRHISKGSKMFSVIRESQACERTVEAAADFSGNLFGPYWHGFDSDWQELSRIVDWAVRLHRAAREGQAATDRARSAGEEV